MTESLEVVIERQRELRADLEEHKRTHAAFLKEDFKPLATKVDGFMTFQKLLTMLWTGLVFVAGLVVGGGWLHH